MYSLLLSAGAFFPRVGKESRGSWEVSKDGESGAAAWGERFEPGCDNLPQLLALGSGRGGRGLRGEAEDEIGRSLGRLAMHAQPAFPWPRVLSAC